LLQKDSDFVWYLCEDRKIENCRNYISGKWQLISDHQNLQNKKLRLEKLKEIRQDSTGYQELDGVIRQTLDVPVMIEATTFKVIISAFGFQNMEFVKAL